MASTLARRFISPWDPAARAMLEPLRQTLYDTEGIVSTTLLATFFANPLGQPTLNLAVNVVKTYRLTNLETAGQLSSPKLYQIHGIRVHAFPINPTVSIYDQDAADISAVMFSSWFELYIGSKAYLDVPTWMVPSNLGYGTTVGAVHEAGAAIGGAPTEDRSTVVRAFNTSGMHFRLKYNRIFIPPQQNFRCTINLPETLAGAGANAAEYAALSAGRLWQVVFEGLLGREVQ